MPVILDESIPVLLGRLIQGEKRNEWKQDKRKQRKISVN